MHILLNSDQWYWGGLWVLLQTQLLYITTLDAYQLYGKDIGSLHMYQEIDYNYFIFP